MDKRIMIAAVVAVALAIIVGLMWYRKRAEKEAPAEQASISAAAWAPVNPPGVAVVAMPAQESFSISELQGSVQRPRSEDSIFSVIQSREQRT